LAEKAIISLIEILRISITRKPRILIRHHDGNNKKYLLFFDDREVRPFGMRKISNGGFRYLDIMRSTYATNDICENPKLTGSTLKLNSEENDSWLVQTYPN